MTASYLGVNIFHGRWNFRKDRLNIMLLLNDDDDDDAKALPTGVPKDDAMKKGG